MIIFESILTTFEASFIFWASWGSIENWLELKIEPPLANLASLNPWNTLYNNVWTATNTTNKQSQIPQVPLKIEHFDNKDNTYNYNKY